MKRLLLIMILMALAIPVRAEVQKPNTRSADVVFVDGRDFYLHKVMKGETMYSLSKLYNIPIERIEFDNPQLKEGLKEGQTIKVLCEEVPESNMSPRKAARLFAEHTVGKGETTYSIARRYSLSINTLVQDNPGLDPSKLDIGQKLKIRKSEIGETSPQELMSEIDDYASSLNRVSEGYIYHVVEIGETIYSLSRSLGVTQEDIARNNDVAGGLKAGALIKVPVEGKDLTRPYQQAIRETATAQQPQTWPADRFPSQAAPNAIVPVAPFVPSEEKNPFYSYSGNLDIAMILPLSGPFVSSSARNNFIEFYQGALLALEDIKNEGYSVNLDLYDDQRSVEGASGIVGSPAFQETDLIIGPVYEEAMQPVMEFAANRNIPVVSPLAMVEKGYGSQLYQLSPAPQYKYEKMRPMFEGDKNIVFITTDNNDWEFEREITAMLGDTPFQRVVYDKGTPAEYIDSLLMSPRRENLFIVTAADELGVDLILAAVSSVQNNRLARSIRTGQVNVIGNSRWLRYRNLDRNLMFKLNVSFVTSYHADRSDDLVKGFDNRYIVAFNELPSLYSYRGYDAVVLFAGAMLGPPEFRLNERLGAGGKPLQVDYDFHRGENGNYNNTRWALVRYRNNYTITVQ